MGRKTFESLGKPLPERRNIIVTRNPSYTAEGCEVAHSLEEALSRVEGSEEAMILGGGQIYSEAIDLADRIYLTQVDTEAEGDTYFPELDWTEWKTVHRRDHAADEKNDYACTFLTLERSQPVS